MPFFAVMEDTALASVVIAALVLLMVIYNAILAKKHFKISVTPKLSLRVSFFAEGDIDWMRVKLSNSGIGPAEIVRSTFEFDGCKIPTTADHKEIKEFIERNIPRDLPLPFLISTDGLFPGTWLAPKDEPVCVLSIRVFHGLFINHRAVGNLKVGARKKGEIEDGYSDDFMKRFTTEFHYKSALKEPDVEKFPPDPDPPASEIAAWGGQYYLNCD